MPKVKSKAPKHLRPYLFHGLELSWSDDDDNAMGDCPFCETEGKFGVKLSNGQYNCFHGCTGNVTTFLRWLWEKSDAKTNDYSELAESRGLLPETLMQWGVAKSILRPSWLVPGYNVKGEINQLYRYVRLHTGKYRLLATPKYVGEDSEKIGHQLFGVNLFDKKKPETFICEGPWDAMSLWEMLRQTKQTDDGLRATANVEGSLLAEANVLGVPGCNVWVPRWGTLLDGKVVNFMFDNDHPRESATGKSLLPASLLGTERAVGILNSATHPPVEINYLRWGRQGYDVTLPNGYDIRDALVLPSLPKVAGNGARRGLGGDPAQTDARRGLEARLTALQALLGNLVPIPQAWLRSAPTASDENNTADRGLECAPCTEYSQLVIAWRKALKWTAGLDHALVVMLASIASTKMIGDQLWIKVIGPAACLDGQTPIHDPVDETTATIESRWLKGKRFSVWSRMSNGSIGIAQALVPQKYKAQLMYEVRFQSGRSIRVTGGHRFWDGSSYVAVGTIAGELQRCAAYPLPSILDTCLLARKRGACHWTQTTEDSLSRCCACFHHGDEQPLLTEDTSRGASPLPTDAQERSQPNCSEDGLDSEYKYTHQHSGPPSNSGYFLSCPSLRCEGGFQLQKHEGISEQSAGLYVSSSQSHPRKHQIGTKRAFSLSLNETREQIGMQYPPLLGSCIRGPGQPLASLQSAPEKSLVHTERHTDRFSLDSTASWVTPIQREYKRYGPIILTDSVTSIKPCGYKEYYDFHVPETQNYWAEGVFHHNCGKSTLCEALSVNKQHVLAKSTIRGFHSGYKTKGQENQDNSLIALLPGKTLVIKDGDTLLQSPNLPQILSEGRDIYDCVSRTHYRNEKSQDYVGIRMTWILCGTSSLRSIDSSELGERFLDCVIMDGINDDLEDEIIWRVANRASRSVTLETDGEAATQYELELVEAMQLTGGYIDYLRENAAKAIAKIASPRQALLYCARLGKFVAYMRARPSVRQEETAEREFATRLVSQLVRLAKCSAFVLNRRTLDEPVMNCVTRVAMDTARGQTLGITQYLYDVGEKGAESRAVSMFSKHTTEERARSLLRFLRQIGVVEMTQPGSSGIRSKRRWKLTARVRELYRGILDGASF